MLDDHKNGIKDNYRKIWAIYSFLKWYQVFFEESPKQEKSYIDSKKLKGQKINIKFLNLA